MRRAAPPAAGRAIPPGLIGRGANLRRVADDLRALGPSAALRAGYEASKRFGGHELVFGRLARSDATLPAFVPPLGRVADPVPAAAATRTLEAADRLLGGQVTIFGRDLPLPEEPDWHSVLHLPGQWPLEPWWRIDIRSDRRLGDVKWVWELGRHRHLVILARAVHLEPGDSPCLALLEAQLRSWLAQNPPEQGVHWYSNLEICLRVLAWLQVLALAGHLLPDDVTAAMTAVLFHSGRHLVVDLPYTVSSMRNNHLLGDALGLVALGKAFGGRGASRWWAGLGDRLFVAQLERHMRVDGSMIEDSLGYHRFVLEMLATRVLLGDPPDGVAEQLVAGAQFLARLGVGEGGVVPQYGDWDEGRVLASTGHPADLTGTVHLALALGGTGAPAIVAGGARRGLLVRSRGCAGVSRTGRAKRARRRRRAGPGRERAFHGRVEGGRRHVPRPRRPLFHGRRRRRRMGRR